MSPLRRGTVDAARHCWRENDRERICRLCRSDAAISRGIRSAARRRRPRAPDSRRRTRFGTRTRRFRAQTGAIRVRFRGQLHVVVVVPAADFTSSRVVSPRGRDFALGDRVHSIRVPAFDLARDLADFAHKLAQLATAPAANFTPLSEPTVNCRGLRARETASPGAELEARRGARNETLPRVHCGRVSERDGAELAKDTATAAPPRRRRALTDFAVALPTSRTQSHRRRGVVARVGCAFVRRFCAV